MARVGSGVHVDYPIMSDADFYARGEPLANDRPFFSLAEQSRIASSTSSSQRCQFESRAMMSSSVRSTSRQETATQMARSSAPHSFAPNLEATRPLRRRGRGRDAAWNVALAFASGSHARLRRLRR